MNEQEKINADHFGPFKVLADKIGHKYYDYWSSQGVLTNKQIVRMQEVNLVADILIARLEGIKSKKQIKKYYDLYESAFEYDTEELEVDFDRTITAIEKIYPEGLSDTEFRRPHLFYSLFITISQWLIKNSKPNRPPPEVIRNKLERVEEIFAEEDVKNLSKDEQQFLNDCRRATTDEKVRLRRSEFLLNTIS